MDFFPSFTWAIPTAFSGAVYLCRFEEGDTFYDHRDAYEMDWDVACQQVEHSLQVRFPVRSVSGITNSGEGIFEHNWKSEIKVDLFNRFVREKVITTTQGRLYTALWRGDLTILEQDSGLPRPIRLQKVVKMLEEVRACASGYARGKRVFVLPRDRSSALSKLKCQKIHSCLRAYLQQEPAILLPQEAGFKQWSQIAPTIDIVLFPVDIQSNERLVELIKSAVYTSSGNASRFKINRHGIVV